MKIYISLLSQPLDKIRNISSNQEARFHNLWQIKSQGSNFSFFCWGFFADISSWYGLHYTKRSLMSWVIVIPKEGQNQKFSNFFNYKKSVSYQKKGGRCAGPYGPGSPARPSFFWYDNDSGHNVPFRVTQPIFLLGLFADMSCWFDDMSYVTRKRARPRIAGCKINQIIGFPRHPNHWREANLNVMKRKNKAMIPFPFEKPERAVKTQFSRHAFQKETQHPSFGIIQSHTKKQGSMET